MKTMSIGRLWLVTAGFGLALAPPLVAQTPLAREPARRDIGVERVLGMRAQLGLTAEQIQKLEGLRKERLEARKARMSEMLELRSQLEAGDLTRDEFRARIQARGEELRSRAADRGAPAREVLTDAQREKLQQLGRQAIRRQRVMALREWRLRRGAGFGGDRGFGQFGPRGMGPSRFGPGMRPELRRELRRGALTPRLTRPRPAPDSTGRSRPGH